MYRLYYRQQGKRPTVSAASRCSARKTIAAIPVSSEWELYYKGLFSREWRLIDYGFK